MKTRRFLTVTVIVLLLSAGLFMGSREGVATAAPPPPNPGVPLDVILMKLTQLQTAVSSLQTQVSNLPTSVDLGGVTHNWDENLPSASRFAVLTSFNNEAVRDDNTGLVWEQSPDTTTRAWAIATLYCVNKTVGGTVGWRLPSVAELNSVRAPSLAAPFVPASIFSGVQSADYWSATTDPQNPTILAWLVGFGDGTLGSGTKSVTHNVWCVRGEMNTDTY